MASARNGKTRGSFSMERPQLGRMRSNEYKGDSMLSMTLDDLNEGGSIHTTRGSFTLSCWDNQTSDLFTTHEEGWEQASNLQSSAMERRSSHAKTRRRSSRFGMPPRAPLSQQHLMFQPQHQDRKVRFNLCPDIQEIDRVELRDYHLIYYGANELQEIMNDFKLEEREAGRVVTLPRGG